MKKLIIIAAIIYISIMIGNNLVDNVINNLNDRTAKINTVLENLN